MRVLAKQGATRSKRRRVSDNHSNTSRIRRKKKAGLFVFLKSSLQILKVEAPLTLTLAGDGMGMRLFVAVVGQICLASDEAYSRPLRSVVHWGNALPLEFDKSSPVSQCVVIVVGLYYFMGL